MKVLPLKKSELPTIRGQQPWIPKEEDLARFHCLEYGDTPVMYRPKS